MQYALINRETKVVENIIELDPLDIDYSGPVDPIRSCYRAPDGYMLLEAVGADIGKKYIEGRYV